MRSFAVFAVLVAAVAAVPMPEDGAADAVENICDLPPIQPGLIQCAAYSERWTFDKSVGTCVKYVYGGCRATENLFPTEVACLLKCNKKALLRESSSLPPACTQPLAVGSCKGFKKRYYYNAEKGACETFNYGGCRGNDNNFESLEQCQTTCEASSQQPAVSPVTLPATVRAAPADPICSLPPIKTENGISCLAFIPSWTFNVELGKCERYIYGGCGKTENLFPTEQACSARCVATS